MDPNGRIPLPQSMLISAVRYALGRLTYIVPETIEEVEESWPSLSDKTRLVILSDLTEFLARDRWPMSRADLGDVHQPWSDLLDRLKREEGLA